MNTTSIFFNQSFDKKRLKAFLYWVLKTFGEKEALTVVEQLKSIGFSNATKAGLSIGLHDLKTPHKKRFFISQAQKTMRKTDQEFQGAEVTATERSQRIVDTWHRTSEDLKKQVVDYFSTYDQLNSVYMMALSGARGNFSQVRQLIGMRGLMADPQGQIISFPIRSNLREGLTLTEYFISCSGARKGLVDTALRTADTGYLTRRLVDISHHIVIKKVTCYTSRGIALKTLRTSQKVLLPLRERLVGRVLAENIYNQNDLLSFDSKDVGVIKQKTDIQKGICQVDSKKAPTQLDPFVRKQSIFTKEQKNILIAKKNQEVSPDLALKISSARETAFGFKTVQVLVRSPLTCTYTHELCQLCYGWSMAQGSLVSLGEAVGVIAGQSIGEPGTQLTMRTFHTGGVFSGDLLQEIRAPHSGKIVFPKALQGLLIRTSQGKIAFLIKVPGELFIDSNSNDRQDLKNEKTSFRQKTSLPLAPSTILFVRQGEIVKGNQILAELAMTGEEGNQPIKSRQTLFSEMRGRIVQWKSMTSRMHRTKGAPIIKHVKEKLFNKNVVRVTCIDEVFTESSTKTLTATKTKSKTPFSLQLKLQLQLEFAKNRSEYQSKILSKASNDPLELSFDRGREMQAPTVAKNKETVSSTENKCSIHLKDICNNLLLLTKPNFVDKRFALNRLKNFTFFVRQTCTLARRVPYYLPKRNFGLKTVGRKLSDFRGVKRLTKYQNKVFIASFVHPELKIQNQENYQKFVPVSLDNQTKFWYIQQQNDSNFVPVFSFLGSISVIREARKAKLCGIAKLHVKSGIQACLGTSTRSVSFLELKKSNSINPAWLAERNVQRHEETKHNVNKLTLKKIVSAKKHGLGSIEPPQALQLGLLGVIATRVGASEKTCPRVIRYNQRNVFKATLKTEISKKSVTNSRLPISLNFSSNPKSANLLHNYVARTYLNKTSKGVLTTKAARNVFYNDSVRKQSFVKHLNTIAEEGDLVDVGYNKV